MTFYKLEHIPFGKLEIQIEMRLFIIDCNCITCCIAKNSYINDFKRVLKLLYNEVGYFYVYHWVNGLNQV